MITRYHLLILAALVVAMGCGSGGTGASNTASAGAKDGGLSGKLVITGASTIAPLCSELGKKFESKNPGVRIDVQTGGSARGIADTRSGTADIGMCSRKLKDDEKELHGFTVAGDGVCVIVHKDNSVEKLSNEQVVAMYTGKITNWKDVGGKDATIVVVNKAEGRSTLELFCTYYKLKNPDIKAHVVIGDNEQGVKTVAGNPNAIGYVSIGTAEYDAKQNIPIKLLPIGGIAASLANVKNGTFPLSRPLLLVTKEEPKGLARAFLDFACSKDVNDIIKEQFFVPIKE